MTIDDFRAHREKMEAIGMKPAEGGFYIGMIPKWLADELRADPNTGHEPPLGYSRKINGATFAGVRDGFVWYECTKVFK